MSTQLANARLRSHLTYISRSTDPTIVTEDDVVGNESKDSEGLDASRKFGILPPIRDKHPLDKGTCLIVGDSLLNNVQEKKMGPKFKVRSFPGCVVNDLYFHVTPLLHKKPSSIIIMAGTNDATEKTSKAIFDELMILKEFIENEAPGM